MGKKYKIAIAIAVLAVAIFISLFYYFSNIYLNPDAKATAEYFDKIAGESYVRVIMSEDLGNRISRHNERIIPILDNDKFPGYIIKEGDLANKELGCNKVKQFGQYIIYKFPEDYTFKEDGKVDTITYLDPNGKPKEREGVLKIQYVYNDKGEVALERRYDKEGLRILGKTMKADEVYVKIPGISREYEFVFASDMHINVVDEYVNPDNLPLAEARRDNLFVNEDGVTSTDYWEDVIDDINSVQADGVLLGADMVDFASPSTIRELSRGFDKLKSRYMYIRADHDNEPYGCEEKVSSEEVTALQVAIDGSPEIAEWEFDEFIIMGWDNNTSQMSSNALIKAKSIITKNKPIILMCHVPLEPELDATLAAESKKIWADRALIWGEDCNYRPREETKEFLDLVYSKDSPFVQILSGHLHFSWDGKLTEKTAQHVFSAAFTKMAGTIVVGP